MSKPQLYEGHPDANHPLAHRVGDYIQFEGAKGSLCPTLRDALESLAQTELADLGRGKPDCNRYLDDSRFFPRDPYGGHFGGGGPLGGDPAGGGR